jgi:integrase
VGNILKYKILNNIKSELKKMDENDLLNSFNKNLELIKTKNTLTITSENDEEKSLIEDITQKTIRSIKRRQIKKVETNIQLKTTRKSKNTIRKFVDLYINYLKLTKKSEKTIENYIPKLEILIEYFNYKKIFSLNDIQKKDCKELQMFLLNFPKNINKYQELKDKNIFELIDKNSKILDNYKKLEMITVDNYITRYKTLFNFLLEYEYIYTNHFLNITNIKPKKRNTLMDFTKSEDIRQQFEIEEIELLLNKIENKEIKNIIILSIITGGRVTELLNLKTNDIIKYKYSYLIDIKKSKTENGIRKIPLHDDFKFLIEELKENKKDEDYLFFNNDIEKNRNDKLQKRIMYQIRKYIKNKNKVFHSFRKNFTQQLYKSEIEELYIKIILGHSLKDNLSFNTYNLSRINNDILMTQINKVNFKELFNNYNLINKQLKDNNINENINKTLNFLNS